MTPSDANQVSELDFFISRRGSSAAAAQEVADVLRYAGYSVLVQDYDILLGDNQGENLASIRMRRRRV
jgi:hypothetical protein